MHILDLSVNSPIPNEISKIQITNDHSVPVVRSLLEILNTLKETEVRELDLGDLLTHLSEEELKNVFLAFPPSITCLSVTSFPQICGVFPPNLQQLLIAGAKLPLRDLVYIREANKAYEHIHQLDEVMNKRITLLGKGYDTQKQEMFAALKGIFTPPEGQSFMELDLLIPFKRWKEKYNLITARYNYLFSNLSRFNRLNRIKDLLKDAKDEESLRVASNQLPEDLAFFLKEKSYEFYSNFEQSSRDLSFTAFYPDFVVMEIHPFINLERLLAEVCAQGDSEFLNYLFEKIICSVALRTTLIEANHYGLYCQAVKKNQLPILIKLESIVSRETLQKILKVDNYSPLRTAIQEGNWDIFLHLSEKLPIEQLITAVKAKNHKIYREAAERGNLEFFKYLEEKLGPEVIKQHLLEIGGRIYAEAIENNQLQILNYLEQQLGDEKFKDMLQARGKDFYRSALSNGHWQIGDYLEQKLETCTIQEILTEYGEELYKEAINEGNVQLLNYLECKLEIKIAASSLENGYFKVFEKIIELEHGLEHRKEYEAPDNWFKMLTYFEERLDSTSLEIIRWKAYESAIEKEALQVLAYLKEKLENGSLINLVKLYKIAIIHSSSLQFLLYLENQLGNESIQNLLENQGEALYDHAFRNLCDKIERDTYSWVSKSEDHLGIVTNNCIKFTRVIVHLEGKLKGKEIPSILDQIKWGWCIQVISKIRARNPYGNTNGKVFLPVLEKLLEKLEIQQSTRDELFSSLKETDKSGFVSREKVVEIFLPRLKNILTLAGKTKDISPLEKLEKMLGYGYWGRSKEWSELLLEQLKTADDFIAIFKNPSVHILKYFNVKMGFDYPSLLACLANDKGNKDSLLNMISETIRLPNIEEYSRDSAGAELLFLYLNYLVNYSADQEDIYLLLTFENVNQLAREKWSKADYNRLFSVPQKPGVILSSVPPQTNHPTKRLLSTFFNAEQGAGEPPAKRPSPGTPGLH